MGLESLQWLDLAESCKTKEGSCHILSRNVTQTDLLFVVRSSLWLQITQRGKDGKQVRELLW